ncbi:MAG: YaiI/YqxD family protein [Planctomycetes bacterium]|nr:YaiI/YqxD family protein [Planctomycetota bacterium]
MLRIFIDADACPVKAETYRVAKRHALLVTVVANQWMDMPNDPMVRLEVVDDGFDAADHWIVEHAARGDIVICDDIPLTARCIAKGTRVLTGRGLIHDENSIGGALASRELMQYLRDAGAVKGGQKPMSEQDRALYLRELEKLIHSVKKHGY